MRGVTLSVLLFIALFASENNSTLSGEKLFKSYCWGCHHPTAEAFGPSFATIASKRSEAEIMAMIATPAKTSKQLGYKRNSMPSFSDLSIDEIKTLAQYVLQFKDAKEN